jgi:hypothetical protein
MVDPRACLDGEVVEPIDGLHAGISANQRELLRFIAEFDARKRWQRDGCRDMAGWLSGRIGISTWAARRWVDAAHALEYLPHLSQALHTGLLCLDKVVELSRFATPENEAKLIAWARRVSVAAIRRKADAANRPSLDDTREIEGSRFLRWWWFDDGRRLGLEGEFPAAQGCAITKAITRAAEQLPALPRDELCTDLGASTEDLVHERSADALFAMSSRAISEDGDADRATVVVHTTLGEEHGGEIEGGPVIHPEVVRRLACDARLQFVVTDAEGNALGIGRASRNVPGWLMRELRYRDHGCTFPGCGTRGFLQAHHVHQWEHGGPTDLDNLVLTCHFHHKLVHEFGWNVRLNGSIPQWFRPSGRRYEPGPDPPERPPVVDSTVASLPRDGPSEVAA